MQVNTAGAGEEIRRVTGNVEDMEQAGSRVTVHIRVGSSVKKIVTRAKEEKISLILMCAHKKNRIHGFRHGNTSFSVMRSVKKQERVMRG